MVLSADIAIDAHDAAILRPLAGQVADLAARSIEAEKRTLWLRHNALEATRPLIFCDPENGWHEIIRPEHLACAGDLARAWEFHLRREIFWGDELADDRVIQPYFDVSHVATESDWGMHETKIGGDHGGAYTWDAPLKEYADLSRLHFPCIEVDHGATAARVEQADAIFGDLLQVRVKTSWWWTLGMTWTLVNLRGLEQIMYDMVDAPDDLHRLMALLRDGTLARLDWLEAQGLLSLNNDGTYVGSGGFGWSRELPQPDFTGHVRTCDLWGFAESQETVGVSPAMFAEFVLPYQLPILARFGLNCYGCCEPLDLRWEHVKQIPRLRRVSVSPWSERAFMAERLGADYVLSMKPNPADLARDSFNEERIRAGLRQDLHVTRACRVEVIIKDNHTIRNDPRRVLRWVQIAREEAEAL